MAVTIPTASQDAACDAIVDLADAGTGAGTLQIRSGTKPAPNDTASGTLLAEFTLANPAFGASASGTATLQGTPLATVGLADGEATWFRALDGDDATVLDGSVSATGGGGDLELNTTTITIDVDVEVTAGSVTMPSGA
ncbi:MAG: hypothetical protein GEU78_14455 [Actinobacteria bacterium]|nr:hypothetical protein [Actinomycetota bacterium]